MDRYGPDVEFDLYHFWGVDIHDFFDPNIGRSPAQLYDFVERLPRTSRLSTAQVRDVEAYREMVAANGGRVPKRKPDPPELYEWTWEHEALGAIFYQLQNIAHLIAHQNAKKRSRFKGVQWPTPRTAADIVRKEDQRKAFDYLEEIVRYEPTDEWLARQQERKG